MDTTKTEPTKPKIDLEEVIKSKNPKLLKFIPKFILNKVKRIIHQDEVNDFISKNYNKSAYEFVDNGLIMFGANIKVNGAENIPQNKRIIFVANHPLGGLDGLVFMKVTHDLVGELRFPVNDLLLNLPALRDIFLPINKHGANSREAIKTLDDAYQSDIPILYFPAGLCSRKIKGRIIDLEWKKSFVSQAIKHQRDIIPVYISGQNSNFFYNLSNLRKKIGIKANIEMLWLVDEMYNQYNKDVTINFGQPISWKSIDKSKNLNEWATYIREKAYAMA